MQKKPRVRTLVDSQDVQGSERLLESARQCFCDIFRSLWKKISSKSSVFVVSEIWSLFVNIMTPDDKSSFSVKMRV